MSQYLASLNVIHENPSKMVWNVASHRPPHARPTPAFHVARPVCPKQREAGTSDSARGASPHGIWPCAFTQRPRRVTVSGSVSGVGGGPACYGVLGRVVVEYSKVTKEVLFIVLLYHTVSFCFSSRSL